MTQFFFHVRDGDDYRLDEEGTDLPDLEAARHEAILAAQEMMAEKVLEGKTIDGQQFEITADHGTLLDVVPFKSVVRLG